MQKRNKNKFLRIAQIVLSKKIHLSIFLFALILPVVLFTMMQERKDADGTISPSLVTKRFGECPTCDILTTDQNNPISMDTIVETNAPDSNYGGLADLHVRYTKNLLMYYNLSSIPVNTRVTSAKLKIFIGINYHEGNGGLSQPIYRLHGSGLWKEDEVTYNKKSNSVFWGGTSGSIATAYSEMTDKISDIYIKNWSERKFNSSGTYLEADMTTVVQDWVNNPQNNLGFLMPSHNSLNLHLNSSEADNPEDALVRPYMEITYEGVNEETIPQPSDIQVKHHSGQSFITWNEVSTGKNDTSYRIYRHNQPITTNNIASAELVGQVYQGSSYLRYSGRIVQPNLTPIGLNITENSGLFAYSSEGMQNSYFAVTTVVEGNENRELGIQNSTANGISESPGIQDAFFLEIGSNSDYSVYVMWVSSYNAKDPQDIYGFTNLDSMPVIFSVVLPKDVKNSSVTNTSDPKYLSLQERIQKTPLISSQKFPLTIYLHPWSHSVIGSSEGAANSQVGGGFSLNFQDNYEMVYKDKNNQVQFLGNFIESDDFGYNWYSGWNSNYFPTLVTKGLVKTFKPLKPFNSGRSVLYMEKSIRYIAEWMQETSSWSKNIDKDRLYMTGGSMGGGGSLTLSAHNPGFVTAIDITVPFTEMHDNLFEVMSRTQWGTEAENISTPPGVGGPDGVPIYDYLNIGSWIVDHKGENYPIMRLRNGKKDVTVPWNPYTPNFYTKANSSKINFQAYFDYGDHNGCMIYEIVDNSPKCVASDSAFKTATPEYIFNPNLAITQNTPFWNYFHFKTNQSYPAFSNFSKNSDPGNGALASGDLRGAINRYQTWDTNSIVDTSTVYSINLSMYSNLPPIERSPGVYLDISDVETTDVTLRRLQNFAKGLPPGQRFKWQNIRLSDNAVIQEGGVLSDSDGLITIPSFQILKAGSKLSVEVINDGVVRATLPTSYSTYIGLPVTVAAFITGIVPTSANYFWTAPTGVELSQTDTNGSISALSKTYSTGGPPNAGYSLTLKILDGEPTTTLAEASTTLYVHKLADINGDNSINFTDFSTLLSSWGTPANPMANIIREGASATKVDFQDFSVLLSKWGS